MDARFAFLAGFYLPGCAGLQYDRRTTQTIIEREVLPMDNDKLENLLKELVDEIERTRNLDDRGENLLKHIKEEINALIEQSSENKMPPRPSLVDNMEESISHLETTHPHLTMLISEILSILSNAGI
jgi:hypothetical protein